jgi:toxin-antitoxin system PIN domain toxin
MILADVNVLIYAFRRECPQHAVCRAWLDGVVLSDERFGLSPLALAAVVRVTTNRRFYGQPSSFDDAFGFCEDLLGQPHCQLVEPRERHWDIFRRLCVDTDTRGPRVTDAWYAALAIEWDCEWITLDRDFVRFPGLRWRQPETPSHGGAQ